MAHRHVCELRETNSGFIWTDRKGKSWKLTLRKGQDFEGKVIKFDIGEDCPGFAYGYSEATLIRDKYTSIIGPYGEVFIRLSNRVR